jgi:hypothetical protein
LELLAALGVTHYRDSTDSINEAMIRTFIANGCKRVDTISRNYLFLKEESSSPQ